jgi:hypothetical protein
MMLRLVNIQHSVTLVPQTYDMGCWSAATSMLLGSRMTVGPGPAKLTSVGGLDVKTDLKDLTNVRLFARAYGLQFQEPQCWTIGGLLELLRRSPVMMCGLVPDVLHAVVIGSAVGDATASGTHLRIYDPLPVNKGTELSATYATIVLTYPEATSFLLHR